MDDADAPAEEHRKCREQPEHSGVVLGRCVEHHPLIREVSHDEPQGERDAP